MSLSSTTPSSFTGPQQLPEDPVLPVQVFRVMASTRPLQIMCNASIPQIADRAVGRGTLYAATVVCQIGGLIGSSCWLSVALSNDNADAASLPLQFQDRRSITSPAVPKG